MPIYSVYTWPKTRGESVIYDKLNVLIHLTILTCIKNKQFWLMILKLFKILSECYIIDVYLNFRLGFKILNVINF